MANSKPTGLLVIGDGRHGKDTFCDFLRDDHGLRFVSSSEFVGREILWDKWGSRRTWRSLWLRRRYPNFDAMFADRSNHRATWFHHITAYNTPDATKTAATMFSRGYHIYCGMRSRREFEAGRAAGIFSLVVWVDRSEHLPRESRDSMQLTRQDADIVIDNNGSLQHLRAQAAATAQIFQQAQGLQNAHT